MRKATTLVAATGLTLTFTPGTSQAEPPPEPAVRISNLPQRFVTAHRGAGSYLAPENTEQAFERGLADPSAHLLEFDVQTLADGAAGVWHDDTVDRISTATGPVSSFDSAAFKQLTIDAPGWFGGGVSATHPMLLNEVLDKFGGKKLLLAEPKDTAAMRLIIDEVTKRNLTDQVQVQTFYLDDAKLARQAGMVAQVLIGSETHAAGNTPQVLKDAGISRVSLWSGLSDSLIAGYVNAGLIVSCYSVNRQYRRDQLYKIGVRGIDTDDPAYGAGDVARYHRTSDPFRTQTWWYGHMSQTQGAAALGTQHRGTFTAPGWWTIPRGTYPVFVRQGWASPVPRTFNLQLWMRHDSLGADKTRWGGVYFSALRDHRYTDATSDGYNAGYSVILRENGQVQLYRKEPTRTVLLKTVTTTAPKAGTIAKFSIRVNSTSVYVRRYDVTTPGFTVSDSKYRGGYLYFGRSAGTGHEGPGISFGNAIFS